MVEHLTTDRSAMAGSPALVMRLLASAFSVAERAGSIEVRSNDPSRACPCAQTGANDLQTLADRMAQKSICTSLQRRFPKITIIGEEDLPNETVEEDLIEDGMAEEVLQKACPADYCDFKEEEFVVWVDPLDGTKEYTEGLLDHVTVLIGIAYKGKAIAGVINQPFFNYQSGTDAVLGRTLWGMLGLGSFGFKLQEQQSGDGLRGCDGASRGHQSGRGREQDHPAGGGESLCLRLASPGCKKWDTCGPEAILHAVGVRASLST
ncbi:hypothetical protein AAFF_G00320860, partial [Aldrovandia affinis]